MYMAPRTPSPIMIDFVCEAPPPGIKQTTAIAARARSIKRFIGTPILFRSAASCAATIDRCGVIGCRGRLSVSSGTTRDIGRLGAFSPSNDNPYILGPVNNADRGFTALKPNRPSLRQQFEIFIRDLFVRHPRSTKKLASNGRF